MKSTKPLMIATAVAALFSAPGFAADPLDNQYRNPTAAEIRAQSGASVTTSGEAAQKGAQGGDSGAMGNARIGTRPGENTYPAERGSVGGAPTSGAQVNTTSRATESSIDAQRRDADGTGQTTGPAKGYNAQTPGGSRSVDRDAATRAQKGAAGGDSGQLGASSSTGTGVRGEAQTGNANTVRGSAGSTTTVQGGLIDQSGAAVTTQGGVTTTVVPNDYRPAVPAQR